MSIQDFKVFDSRTNARNMECHVKVMKLKDQKPEMNKEQKLL